MISTAAPVLAATYTTVTNETWVVEPARGVQIYTRVLQPDPALYGGEVFPAVVHAPGGTGDGAPGADRPEYQALAAMGFVVVVFNPPGRGTGGPGNLISGGEEDFNGFAGQDALKAVIEYAASLSAVNSSNLGVQTSSYGITLGAGALGRYPDLPVAWLVDMEGPSNSLITACYYCDTERGLGGHLGTVTDPSPENEAWWSEREACRFIGAFRGAYLRAQAWDDHVQPPGLVLHAEEMNDQAVAGGVPWVRVNGSDVGNPVNVLSSEVALTWLPGRMSDHRDRSISYIVEMARMFGATVPPMWRTVLDLPHDVDRLATGNTLVTSGRRPSQVIEIDAEGEIVGLYLGELVFAHNADRLDSGHTVISDTGNHRVLEIDQDNIVVWSSDWVTLDDGSALEYPNDVNRLAGGTLLITDRNNHRVIEIDATGRVLWQHGETAVRGDGPQPLDGPHNADRLANGNTLIADSNNDRIVEVTPAGEIAWSWAPTGDDALDWPRDADRLVDGNTLITDSGNHRVAEVDSAGTILWQLATGLGMPYDADRLDNGNTLVADSGNHRVVEVDSSQRIVWQYPAVATPDRSSPFGFHPAKVSAPGYPDSGFADAEAIGVRWHRPPLYAFWFMTQPDLAQPVYDFTRLDPQYGEVPDGINILANICPENPRSPEGMTEPGSYVPIDPAAYQAFVRATVERYDGDGIDDMAGLTNPVHHWQVGNEPTAELNGFAELQRLTYDAIKEACPACTVLIAGAAGFPDGYVAAFDTVYDPILRQLAGGSVDVFDFHWYGAATGDYRLRDARTGEDVLGHIRAALAAEGFGPELEIWITEMGSYSGDPAPQGLGFQSERQQAADYFRRFVYSLARGVAKVFPAFGLIEGFKIDGGYFDHTGLIYDGAGSDDLGLGVKKLGYFTYARMTQMLAGADLATLTMLHDGTDGDWLYLFRVETAGRPLRIAWWDSFADSIGSPSKPLALTGVAAAAVRVSAVVPAEPTGEQVVDPDASFAVATVRVVDGAAVIDIGEDPVFIEELDQLPPRRPGGRLHP